MSYKQLVKNKAIIFIIAGYFLMIVCILSFVVSLSKGIYFHFDDIPQFQKLSIHLKNLIYEFKKSTLFLNFFWDYSPTPDMMNPFAKSNIWFGLTYVILFSGAILMRYGKGTLSILKEVDRENFKNRLRGKVTEQHERETIEIVLKESFHNSYVRPIIIGLAIPLIIYISKNIFGF